VLAVASDGQLVALLRGGHEEAFEALYDRHHGPILAFCRHMLGSQADGEDATQQTFLSGYRHLAASDEPINLRPWLFTIARNRCLSMLRARRETSPIDDATASTPDTDGLLAEVGRRDDLRALLEDLAALPDQQRAALVLAELGDLSHADVAAVVGCKPAQVKALVYQARTSLMSDRAARDLDCLEIRRQLASARGHELLRGQLRRHLRRCEACSEFAAEVKQQRTAMALLLPVIPTLGLRHATLSSALGSHVATGSTSAAAGLAAGGKSVVLKAIAIGAAAVAAGGAGVATFGHGHHHSGPVAVRHARAPQPSALTRSAAPQGAERPRSTDHRASARSDHHATRHAVPAPARVAAPAGAVIGTGVTAPAAPHVGARHVAHRVAERGGGRRQSTLHRQHANRMHAPVKPGSQKGHAKPPGRSPEPPRTNGGKHAAANAPSAPQPSAPQPTNGNARGGPRK
jgi:RNA polymerase sigma factor (sigma-70 family)